MPGSDKCELKDQELGRGYWAPDPDENRLTAQEIGDECRPVYCPSELQLSLAKIEELKRDLSAEIVIQESRKEEHTNKSWGDRDSGGYGAWGETREIPSITQPDTEKREVAKAQLQQIYDSSKLYYARYVAGQAISIDSQGLARILNEELDKLKIRLKTEIDSGQVEEVVVGSHEEIVGRQAGDPPNTIEVEDYERRPVFVPATRARLDAINEISVLYQRTNSPEAIKLLKESYRNNESREVRASAGRALRHSNLRLWAHEHPVAAVTGIVSSSGLGYMLYQGMVK